MFRFIPPDVRCRLLIVLTFACVSITSSNSLLADFTSQPFNPLQPGSDIERSDTTGATSPRRIADDFQLSQSALPVNNSLWVTWYGSMNINDPEPVLGFRLEFYDAAGQVPGSLKWATQVNVRGQALTHNPNAPNHQFYRYMADIPVLRPLEANTDYWLSIYDIDSRTNNSSPSNLWHWSATYPSVISPPTEFIAESTTLGQPANFRLIQRIDRAFRIEVHAVPEPGSILMLAVCGLGIIRYRRVNQTINFKN